MTLFLYDWAKCVFGSTTSYSGSWGSLDCTTSKTSYCSTTTYNGESCLNIGSWFSPNKLDIDFDCDVKNVSFNIYGVDLSKCGSGKLCDIKFYDDAGKCIDAKFEWVNGCVKVTAAAPIKCIDIINNGSWNYCDFKVGTINCDPVPTGDGLVEGTGGDDVIDATYIGDPEGDRVDNNDAILSGETGNDDIILAGDGNDKVEAGNGNDDVYGGMGNDSISGGAGNDRLYGDQESCYGDPQATTAVRASFNWSEAPDPDCWGGGIDNGDRLNGFTQSVNGVNVTFGTTASNCSPTTTYTTDAENVSGIDDGSETINANSGLSSVLNAYNESATYQLGFSTGVSNIDFRINDIDFDSTVRVYAYNAAGQLVPVTITAGSGVTLSNRDAVAGNETIVSNGGDGAPTSGTYSALVEVAGPITRLVIVHTQDGGYDSGITISDVYFDVTTVDDTAVPGNDIIDGGEGDDYIDGNQGNDTLMGGAGNDRIIGGDGDDKMYGGAGDDIIDDVRGSANDGKGNDFADGGAGNDQIWTGLGNDSILGGEGNDLIDGEAGNDTLDGGEGNDWVFGGADRDVIFGGAGDYVDGGAAGDDYDTLNLSGKGQYYLTNVTPDSNGNGINGTVVFVDANGNPTGETINFVEIENIIGDEYNFAPNAVDDVAETDEDKAVTIDVLANDSDPEGEDLTVTGATATHGTVVVNPDGTVTFTPEANYNGPATITYTVEDESGNTSSATVTVNVLPVNDGPVANDDTAETDEDEPVTIDVLANDTDADGDDLTVVSATSPNGTVVVNPDGTITFTPAEDFTGEATITYVIEDEAGEQSTATVTVNVLPVNDGPVANDDVAETDEDEPVTIDVLANDTDADGDDLTVVSATSPNGTVVVNPDGTITFTPAENFNGETTITYTIEDETGAQSSATVTVNVLPVNDAPVANDDAATTDFNTPVTVAVLANDTDVDGDVLSVVSATSPNGTVVVNPNGTITFTPNPGFEGEATIEYTITDGDLTSTAHVTVTVNEDPRDGTVEGTAGADIINDGYTGDPDGDFVDNNDAILPGDTGNDDLIYGYGGDDKITAGDGDDEVYGGEGNDSIAAGEGDDEVYGGTGNDFIHGQGGNDTLSGEEGDDSILGGHDEDIIYGGSGNDVIDAMSGDDDIHGGAGDDSIIGGGGNDVIHGDDGNDVIQGGNDVDVISGGAGNDVINGGGSADQLYGGLGDDLINGGDGDDTILGQDGNDTLNGDNGNDSIRGGQDEDIINGGSGNDIIDGMSGDDIIDGGEGNDSIIGGGGNDVIKGGAGNDNIAGGNDVDTIDGGTGNDVITGGGSNDVISGGAGDDSITGDDGDDSINAGLGNDTVSGGNGNDYINTSDGVTPRPDLAYPGLWAADTNPNDDKDVVDGGNGNDIILTGDDKDTITGGAGNDYIDGGVDQDSIDAGAGNDTVIGGEGDDIIHAGAGDDLVYGGLGDGFPDAINIPNDEGDLVVNNGRDVIYAEEGNDTVYGKDDDDTIYGGTGNDYLDGGVDDDEIYGDEGTDVIIGGQGNDDLYGGTGSDTFLGGNGGDVVVGGEDADNSDIDVLDLTGSNVDFITYTSADKEDGVVTFLDGSTMTFSEIENVIPCFTPGTMIATPKGERLVEELQVGDKVITRDNGIQEIAWVGHKDMSGKHLVNNPHLKPVLIKAGALGNGLPERDMLVSPNHRLLVASDLTQLYFEESEVLAAAKHLVGSQGIHQIDVMQTTYVHFMFERHEVVLSNGAWTESFQPGDYSLKGIGNGSRNEIFELFPELKSKAGLEGYQAARKSLKKHEAKLLIR